MKNKLINFLNKYFTDIFNLYTTKIMQIIVNRLLLTINYFWLNWVII